jgi:hypothetical protein
MKVYKKSHIIEAIGVYKKNAEEAKNSAGWAGERHDGGASVMMDKIGIFETMWDGKDLMENHVPAFFLPTLEKVDRSYDEEYQEYLKLKMKYEK